MNCLQKIYSSASKTIESINYASINRGIIHRPELTSLALKALGWVAIFSLCGATSGMPQYCNDKINALRLCPVPCYNKTCYYNTEPLKNTLFPYNGYKIYQLPQVQNMLMESVCPP